MQRFPKTFFAEEIKSEADTGLDRLSDNSLQPIFGEHVAPLCEPTPHIFQQQMFHGASSSYGMCTSVLGHVKVRTDTRTEAFLLPIVTSGFV